MNITDKILELIKEKPMLMSELGEKSELPMLEVIDAAIFLKKYGLIATSPTEKGGGLVKITPRGLHLLNLPNLPEDETTGEEITELMLIEQKMADKTINLYSLSQLTETTNWIDDMAIRFNVRPEDVTRALWLGGKTTVWAKLEQDKKEKKRQK